MNELDASPTRMELLNVNAKLLLARRGHDMLKKKRDTLISEYVKAREELSSFRAEATSLIGEGFIEAKLVEMDMGSAAYRNTAYNTTKKIVISIDYKKLVGVKMPIASAKLSEDEELPYSLTGTPPAIDDVVNKFREISVMAVRLAALEKKVHVLYSEIKKTRRKVNALEKVKIKNLELTERYIRAYLDEMEREDYSRLKHIKELIEG